MQQKRQAACRDEARGGSTGQGCVISKELEVGSSECNMGYSIRRGKSFGWRCQNRWSLRRHGSRQQLRRSQRRLSLVPKSWLSNLANRRRYLSCDRKRKIVSVRLEAVHHRTSLEVTSLRSMSAAREKPQPEQVKAPEQVSTPHHSHGLLALRGHRMKSKGSGIVGVD